MVPRSRRIAVRATPSVGGHRSGACRRSLARLAGRKCPDERPCHRSTRPGRRRIVAGTVARGSAERERDGRSGRVRIRAPRLYREPIGRSPSARLGTAGDNGRIHGHSRTRSVHLGTAKRYAAGVASVRWLHRAPANCTHHVHACRGQPRERSGVGFDRRGCRRRATLGVRRARGSRGDPSAPHRRDRSRRRSHTRRAHRHPADRRAGQRDAGTHVDAAPGRRGRPSTPHDAGGAWKPTFDIPAPRL